MGHSLSNFWSTGLKPYHPLIECTFTHDKTGKEVSNPSLFHLSYEFYGEKPSAKIPFQNRLFENQNCIESSHQSRFYQMLDQRVFDIVSVLKEKGFCIYGSRFVNQMKNNDLPTAIEMLRLVLQGFFNNSFNLFTHAPTVLRASQRILFCFLSMFTSLSAFTGDVCQTYTQPKTELTKKMSLSGSHKFWELQSTTSFTRCNLYMVFLKVTITSSKYTTSTIQLKWRWFFPFMTHASCLLPNL